MRHASSAIVSLFGFLTLIAGLTLLFPAPGSGQELRIGVVQSWPGYDLLGSPLGAIVSVGIRVRERVSVRLGYEDTQDRFQTFGSTCFGMLPPEQFPECAPEARREAADIRAVTLSVPLVVLSRERLDLAITPGFRWAWMESQRTGLVTNRELDGDETMWGFSLGGEVVVQPLPSLPARVFLGIHAGFLGQSEYVAIADGYSTFEEGFSLVQMEMGVAFRR